MKLLFLAAIMVGFGATAANAVPISGFGNPLNNDALRGGSQIGFEETPAGLYPSLTIGQVTFTGVGSPLTVGPDFNGMFNTRDGQSLYNDFDLDPSQFRFDFASPVAAFGFNWGASDNTWLLEAFDASGNLLDSQLLPKLDDSNAGDYFGLAASGISYALLTDQKDHHSEGDYVFIDRFTTGDGMVPVPPALLLFGSGLVSLFGMRIQALRTSCRSC